MKLRNIIKPSGAFAYILLAAVIVVSASSTVTALIQQTSAQTIPNIPVERDVDIYFKTFCISVIVVTWCF